MATFFANNHQHIADALFLPVGGIKEKVLAANRAGVNTLILPSQNEKDYLEDVPVEIRDHLKAHFVRSADQVLKLALEKTAPRS